jgi:hypothetical protein
MGGTMDYERFRNRNGIGPDQRPPLTESWPYAGVPPEKHMLSGDLNRMERDCLGLNPASQVEVDRAVKGTGVDREIVLRVLRYHLYWPEPGCDDCGDIASPHEARCNKHRGYEW